MAPDTAGPVQASDIDPCDVSKKAVASSETTETTESRKHTEATEATVSAETASSAEAADTSLATQTVEVTSEEACETEVAGPSAAAAAIAVVDKPEAVPATEVSTASSAVETPAPSKQSSTPAKADAAEAGKKSEKGLPPDKKDAKASPKSTSDELEEMLYDANRWTIFEDLEDEATFLRRRSDVLARGLLDARAEIERLHEAGLMLQEAHEALQDQFQEVAGDAAYWKALAEARAEELADSKATLVASKLLQTGTRVRTSSASSSLGLPASASKPRRDTPASPIATRRPSTSPSPSFRASSLPGALWQGSERISSETQEDQQSRPLPRAPGEEPTAPGEEASENVEEVVEDHTAEADAEIEPEKGPSEDALDLDSDEKEDLDEDLDPREALRRAAREAARAEAARRKRQALRQAASEAAENHSSEGQPSTSSQPLETSCADGQLQAQRRQSIAAVSAYRASLAPAASVTNFLSQGSSLSSCSSNRSLEKQSNQEEQEQQEEQKLQQKPKKKPLGNPSRLSAMSRARRDSMITKTPPRHRTPPPGSSFAHARSPGPAFGSPSRSESLAAAASGGASANAVGGGVRRTLFSPTSAAARGATKYGTGRRLMGGLGGPSRRMSCRGGA